jgi:DNA-binding winged helix-turn-helix (wHTH) protein/TolB-like protein
LFDTLLVFIERPGRLLGKAELMQALWPDTFVAESALTKNISDLRKALGDGKEGVTLIETVPKSGYRFVASVEFAATAEDPPAIPAARNRRRAIVLAAALVLIAAGTGLALWVRARTAAMASPRIESLAILPFRPMTAQNRDEYLEFSMADTLTDRLSSTGQVSVRPTASMTALPEVRPDPVDAGRRLNVDAVVDGTLQKMDGSLRVTARLIRVRDGALMWSASLDDSFAHLFQVQDSLARQLAAALSLRQSEALTKRGTSDIETYEAYQKGRFFAGKRTPEGFERAIGYYKDAIAKDANYAMAWSGLADAYMLSAGYFAAPANPSHGLAREAAARAIALDPQSAEAHTSMALVHENGEWDFRETDKEYRRAIELNPNYATAQDWYGEFLVYMGHTREGLAHLRRAEQIDPLSPNVGGDVAFALLNGRRYDEAITEAKKVLEMHPDFLRAHRALSIAYFWNRTWSLEEEELRRLSDYDAPDDTEAARALFATVSGQPERAVKFIEKYRNNGGRGSGPASREFMTAMFVLHDRLEAINVLQAGYARRDAYMTSLKIGREFDSLRDDARFQSLIRLMKFLE